LELFVCCRRNSFRLDSARVRVRVSVRVRKSNESGLASVSRPDDAEILSNMALMVVYCAAVRPNKVSVASNQAIRVRLMIRVRIRVRMSVRVMVKPRAVGRTLHH